MEDHSSDREHARERRASSDTPATGTVLSSDAPRDELLPPDLQVALARFLGTDSVQTLRTWNRSLREIVGDGRITVDHLCLTSEETPHRGRIDGDTHYFACFFDAVILAALAEEPVEIRTESPQGVEITARVRDYTILNVDPPEAVFSFGIDRHVDPPEEEGPSFQEGYASICPYVKAFPTAEAYRTWATTAPAPTVALPLTAATDLARSLSSELSS